MTKLFLITLFFLSGCTSVNGTAPAPQPFPTWTNCITLCFVCFCVGAFISCIIADAKWYKVAEDVRLHALRYIERVNELLKDSERQKQELMEKMHDIEDAFHNMVYGKRDDRK